MVCWGKIHHANVNNTSWCQSDERKFSSPDWNLGWKSLSSPTIHTMLLPHTLHCISQAEDTGYLKTQAEIWTFTHTRMRMVIIIIIFVYCPFLPIGVGHAMSLRHFTRSCAASLLMLSINFQTFFNTGLPGISGFPTGSSTDLQIHSSSQNGILFPLFHMSKLSKSLFFSAQMRFLLVYISAPLHLRFEDDVQLKCGKSK